MASQMQQPHKAAWRPSGHGTTGIRRNHLQIVHQRNGHNERERKFIVPSINVPPVPYSIHASADYRKDPALDAVIGQGNDHYQD